MYTLKAATGTLGDNLQKILSFLQNRRFPTKHGGSLQNMVVSYKKTGSRSTRVASLRTYARSSLMKTFTHVNIRIGVPFPHVPGSTIPEAPQKSLPKSPKEPKNFPEKVPQMFPEKVPQKFPEKVPKSPRKSPQKLTCRNKHGYAATSIQRHSNRQGQSYGTFIGTYQAIFEVST